VPAQIRKAKLTRRRAPHGADPGACEPGNYECRTGDSYGARKRPVAHGLQKNPQRKNHSSNKKAHSQQQPEPLRESNAIEADSQKGRTAGAFQAICTASRRHLNSWLVFTSCRRATIDTEEPGSSVSDTI